MDSKIAIDDDYVEFLENLQNVRHEVDAHIQKNYCVYGNKLEELKLLQTIWMSASQLMRNPERQNSVNEVIRTNLKAFGRATA